jgi:hypothetical protein
LNYNGFWSAVHPLPGPLPREREHFTPALFQEAKRFRPSLHAVGLSAPNAEFFFKACGGRYPRINEENRPWKPRHRRFTSSTRTTPGSSRCGRPSTSSRFPTTSGS